MPTTELTLASVPAFCALQICPPHVLFERAGGLERIMNKVLGSTSSVFMAQVRMMLPVMLVSTFLNNTRESVALFCTISWLRDIDEHMRLGDMQGHT